MPLTILSPATNAASLMQKLALEMETTTFWEDAEGNHPEPHSCVSLADFQSQKWKVSGHILAHLRKAGINPEDVNYLVCDCFTDLISEQRRAYVRPMAEVSKH